MSALVVTPIVAAVAAVALVLLSVPISLRRAKVGDMVGDSADPALRRRIRAQGNFIEYVPLGLILLGLVEAGGASFPVSAGIGGALALGRLLHAIGMLRDEAVLRGFGVLFTYGALLASAALLIGRAVGVAA